MGVVHRAFDSAFGREVALKVLPEGCQDEELLKRFELEATDFTRFEHPNVVKFYDYARDGGTPFLVLEYLGGGDLRTFADKSPSIEEIVQVYYQVCQGLEHIHRQGVVHRDIKPENILFSSSGIPKLSDFGISRRVAQNSALTQAGAILGTRKYSAPEMVTASSEAGPASDLYSLGVCLFESLTGRLPFVGSSDFAILAGHVNDPPPDPVSLNPEIPSELARVVLALLAKKPEERPESAALTARLLSEAVGLVEQSRPQDPTSELASHGFQLDSETLVRLSHEVWTPMNGVLGMAGLLAESTLNPRQREQLRSLQQSADRLREVLSLGLDLANLSSGTLTLEPVAIDFRALLDSVLRPYRMRRKGATGWEVELDQRAPRGVLADPERLRQMLGRLLQRADRLGRGGKARLQLHVLSCDELAVEVEFRFFYPCLPTGTTSADDFLSSFHQSDLELEHARGLVLLMDGTLSAQEQDKFEVVTAWLRLGLAEVPQSAAHSQFPSDPKALVLDPAGRYAPVSQILARWGMNVSTALSETEAAQVLSQARQAGKPFEIVFLELNGSKVDGLEFLKKHKSSDVAFLLFARHLEEGDSARCRLMGADAVLSRPIKGMDLWEAVVRVLRQGPRPVEPRSTSLNILVAEDNPVNQILALNLLQQHGHRAVLADHGLDALERHSQEPFDLILMDLQMPAMNGLEATREIRKREKESRRYTPIVALTAFTQPSVKEECLKAGMDAFLTKPLEEDKLFQVIHRLLAQEQTQSAPTATEEPEVGIIDEDGLWSRVGRKSKILVRLLDVFFSLYQVQLDEIGQAIAQGSAEELYRSAHKFKGSIANFGAAEAARSARELEESGRAGNLEGTEVEFHRLRELTEQAVVVLRQIRSRHLQLIETGSDATDTP